MDNGLRNTILVGLVLAGWAAIFGFAALSPTAPDPSTGHTIPFNNHGTLQYLTPAVYYLLVGYIPTWIVAALVASRGKWWK